MATSAPAPAASPTCTEIESRKPERGLLLTLVALVVLWVLSIVALVMLSIAIARAAPPPVGDPQNELLAPYGAWVQGLTNPTTGQGCCSLSDCRVADYRIARDGTGYEAFIDQQTWPGGPNAWLSVPAYVVSHRANPTGFAVACWASWHKESNGWFCFVPGSGV